MDLKTIIVAGVIVLLIIYYGFIKKPRKNKEQSLISTGSVSGRKARRGVIGIIARLFRRNRQEQESAIISDSVSEKSGEQKSKYPDVPVYIYDDIQCSCYPMTLPGTEVEKIVAEYGTMGRQRDRERKGDMRFYLDRILDPETNQPKYRPTIFPFDAENTAIMLGMAQQQPEVPEIFNFTPVKSFLEKHGWLVLVCVGGLIALAILNLS
jgi:hypothetical protein